jgi:hypothetical protein
MGNVAHRARFYDNTQFHGLHKVAEYRTQNTYMIPLEICRITIYGFCPAFLQVCHRSMPMYSPGVLLSISKNKSFSA